MLAGSCLGSCVTCIWVEFSNTETERKPQNNVQKRFIKLMLEHKGSSTEERKVLGTDLGAGSACGRQSRLVCKGGLFESGGRFEKGRLSLLVLLSVTTFVPVLWGKMADCSLPITTSGRSCRGQTLINCACRTVVSTLWK